jgi:hypothetical protein
LSSKSVLRTASSFFTATLSKTFSSRMTAQLTSLGASLAAAGKIKTLFLSQQRNSLFMAGRTKSSATSRSSAPYWGFGIRSAWAFVGRATALLLSFQKKSTAAGFGIYPRTVFVSRPNPASPAVGAQGYSALQSAGETVLYTGIPASIQLTRKAGKPDPMVPADPGSLPGWRIFVPGYALSLGQVTENDIVTDDLGKRYQVIGAYWNLLGYALSVTLLEM